MKNGTKSQRMAQAAYQEAKGKDYKGFAREFPTLVHSCGLAQAFVYAKPQTAYRQALAKVLVAAGWMTEAETDVCLEEQMLDMPVLRYVRLSRDALAAAVWIKRFCEADVKESETHA